MKKVNFKIGGENSKSGLKSVTRPVVVGLNVPLFAVAGPCVIESEDVCLDIADRLVKISINSGVPIIFKTSFDKANRSSISSYRGPGLKKGLKILAAVRHKTNLPVMTDVHEPSQAEVVSEVADCLQIPAFLCRQTDLLCACAKTGKPVNIKKGQFVSPDEMKNAVEKVRPKKPLLRWEQARLLLTRRIPSALIVTIVACVATLSYP